MTRGFVAALLGAACVAEVAAQAQTPAPTPLPGLGISTNWYRNADNSKITDYPDFDTRTPYSHSVGVVDLQDYDLYLGGVSVNLASRHTGYLTVTNTGRHSFSLESGNSSRLFINGELIIASGGVGAVDLSIGEHEIRIEFYYSEALQHLKWQWQQPGEENMAVVPKERLNPLFCPFTADGKCKVPPLSGPGMHTAVYDGNIVNGHAAFPDFDSSTAVASWTANVDFAAWPDLGLIGFASRHTGHLTVYVEGNYIFSLEAHGDTRMSIDGWVFFTDAGADRSFSRRKAVYLEPGQHEVRIEYLLGAGVGPHFQWKWQQPGEEDMVVVPKERLNPLVCPTVDDAGRCEAPPLSGLGIYTKEERHYDLITTFSDYPDFDSGNQAMVFVSEVVDIPGPRMYYKGSGSNNFASRYTGYLTVTKAGLHSFSLEDGASSRMYIDGVRIINNGGVGAVYLLTGKHEVRIEFFLSFFHQYLRWQWQQPGEDMVVVPKERLNPLFCPAIDEAGRCEATGMRTALYRADAGKYMGDFANFETRNPDEIWKDGRNVDFSHDEWSLAGYDDNFASRHSGYLVVPVPGNYTFFLTSDDGSRMFLEGVEIISNGGIHGKKTVDATLCLESRKYEVRIEFFELLDGQMLKWEWLQPGNTDKVVVPLEVLIPLYCLRVDVTGKCLPESS
ncbi:PA14 superfamily domain [Diplonema papillatum]|nr:hypothetical protein DIPPA_14961 [Diplonema papillatum]KAJ9439441.1 hypothetical protein DIPPA_14961 [Diplonema papillatum]KAJ9439442.1 hypothetical protein DIPPA_14961 [Diplonema papillatum]KAJ9452750.1 PA14 superfamily domain [Diplonema papillatum]